MEKYKVTEDFIRLLDKVADENDFFARADDTHTFVGWRDISALPSIVADWRLYDGHSVALDAFERNERLIAIIRYLNGEDVFEVEKPHKFVVRSTAADEDGDYRWMYMQGGNYNLDVPFYNELKLCRAKRFNTRMDAELWTTNGYEVVEIDGDGKEVTE